MIALTMVWTYGRALIRAHVADERGASVIEYAFLASLIAAFCAGALALVGSANSASLSESADKLP